MASNISNVNVITSAKDAGAISLMQRLQNESRQTAEAVKKINERMSEIGTSGRSSGTTIATGLVPVIDVASLVQQAIGSLSSAVETLVQKMNNVEDRSDMADVLGFTYEQMQALNVAATLANTTVDNLSGAFSRFLKGVSEAASGSKTAQDELTRLGVSLKELEGKTTFEILGVVADKLRNIESPADRARVAMDLFGKEAGIKMIQVLDGGSVALENYKKRANELGIVLGTDLVSQIKQANAELDIQRLKMNELNAESARLGLVGSYAAATYESAWKKTWDSLVSGYGEFNDTFGAFVGSMVASPNMNAETVAKNARDALRGIETLYSPNAAAAAPASPSVIPVPAKQRKSLDDFYNENVAREQALAEKRAAQLAEESAARIEQQKRIADLYEEQAKLLDDMADANRRLFEQSEQEADSRERSKQAAMDQARSEFSGINAKPELLLSGSAEAQKVAFEAKNSRGQDEARQRAIEERANQLLANIERNTGLMSRQQAFGLVGL